MMETIDVLIKYSSTTVKFLIQTVVEEIKPVVAEKK